MKVCVVGLDGATWDLLDPWVDELPTIRRFAGNVRADLQSCVPPLSIPAWKVYSTGMDPGRLGVFTFVEPDFEDERFKTVTNETFVHREIWDYLGEAGHRSASINMPTTFPPREIPGYMVSGPFSGRQQDYTAPPTLEPMLEREGYTILPDYYLSREPAEIDDAVESVNKKLQTGLEFSSEVDFLHITLFLTDTVQHTEWDSEVAKEFWMEVDSALGQFVEGLDEEWNVLLVSDHGFGQSEGMFYLNSWLEREGYLEYDGSVLDIGDIAGAFGADYATVRKLLVRLNLSGVVKRTVPSSVLRKVARQLPGNRKLEGTESKIDWTSDAIPLAPLIYTRNRAVAEEIRSGLLDVTDRDGEPVIDEIHFGEELYPDCEVRVPDLIIDHTDYVISDVIHSGPMLVYDPDEWAEAKVAHHRRTGILSAMGPDVEDLAAETANLSDLAPTILDGFGADIPVEMSGESLGLLGANGTFRPTETRLDRDRVVDHDTDIEQRLEDLGYI